MASDTLSLLWRAEDAIRAKHGAFKPEWTLVLGSGLEELVGEITDSKATPYPEIPGFTAPTVAGHQGRFISGNLFGKSALILSGRLHFYEGHPMEKIIFPIRLASYLGCKKLVLTAAVGAINRKFQTGDIVALSDHINFMGADPLRGPHDATFGERFPDMKDCYSARLRDAALALAKKSKIKAYPGVYAAVSGPTYDTRSEVSLYGRLGSDVVGMSVVPEAVAAHQMGMEVLALAFVSNPAAGIGKTPLRHEEVLASGKTARKNLAAIIRGILQKF